MLTKTITKKVYCKNYPSQYQISPVNETISKLAACGKIRSKRLTVFQTYGDLYTSHRWFIDTHARTQFSGDVDLWPELTPCCDLHYSAALRPLWDEAAQECQESNGSDLYSPQISSCTGTKREPPSKATQYNNAN